MRPRSWTLAAWLLAGLLAACGPGRGGSSSPPSAGASGVAAVATPAGVSTPAVTPTPAGAVYTVKAGDTLSSIAADNKTSVEVITKANNLADPDKIQIGQKLILPLVESTGAAGASAAAATSGSGLPPAASKPPPP